MFDAVVVAFTAYNLNFQDCHRQSYDKASNMSGLYAGLEALILELRPLILYVPCATHSLNVVGTSAVSSILAIDMFFNYPEDFYNFLVRSTGRWDMLQQKLKSDQKVSKMVIGTRWSSLYNACSAFTNAYNEWNYSTM